MKKKTVLFLGYNFFGYEKVIKNLIETELNYNVIYINKNEYKYSYRNCLEKLWSNLYWKRFKKKSLKDEKVSDLVIKDIKKIEKDVDIIFWIRPIGTDEKLIKYISKLNKKIIIHEWDSINSLHGIEKMAKHLKENNINYKFLIYSKDKNLKSKYLEIINKPITLEESYKYLRKSKVLLEIGHSQQKGLSFRAIDSLGMDKKLITNYKFIEDYDFYNKENIFIMENDNPSIPINFIKSEYKKVDEKIKKEYSDVSWIEKMFL